MEHAEQAISVDPNYPGAYMAKGAALAYSGRRREAHEAATVALRLNPRDPLTAIVRLLLTVIHYFDGDYAERIWRQLEAPSGNSQTIRSHTASWQHRSVNSVGLTRRAPLCSTQWLFLLRASIFTCSSRPPWFTT